MATDPTEDGQNQFEILAQRLDALSLERETLLQEIYLRTSPRIHPERSGLARVLRPLARWLYLQLRQAAFDEPPTAKR